MKLTSIPTLKKVGKSPSFYNTTPRATKLSSKHQGYLDGRVQCSQPCGEFHQAGRWHGGGMRLRLPGRRYMKKITQNGTVISHEYYLYRGYLQLAALDMLNSRNVLRTLLWDPLEPIATRPMALVQGNALYLLWNGLQQERDGSVRWGGNCCGNLRLLALWNG